MNAPFPNHRKLEFSSPEALGQQLLLESARNDLATFVGLAFTAVDRSKYLHNWHIRAIAYQLERVFAGRCKRLIINMPPRSLKSVAASVAFPAWVLGRDPSRKLICVSYSQQLAGTHANNFRNVVDVIFRGMRTLFEG